MQTEKKIKPLQEEEETKFTNHIRNQAFCFRNYFS